MGGRGQSIGRAVLFTICVAVLMTALIGGSLAVARTVVSVVSGIGDSGQIH